MEKLRSGYAWWLTSRIYSVPQGMYAFPSP